MCISSRGGGILRGPGRFGLDGHFRHVGDYTLPAWLRTSSRELRSAVLLDEGQHAAPSVVAGILPLVVSPVEEAVWGALVNLHLVRHARIGELLVEGVKRFLWCLSLIHISE